MQSLPLSGKLISQRQAERERERDRDRDRDRQRQRETERDRERQRERERFLQETVVALTPRPMAPSVLVLNKPEQPVRFPSVRRHVPTGYVVRCHPGCHKICDAGSIDLCTKGCVQSPFTCCRRQQGQNTRCAHDAPSVMHPACAHL